VFPEQLEDSEHALTMGRSPRLARLALPDDIGQGNASNETIGQKRTGSLNPCIPPRLGGLPR